jgi:peptide/nickel transport system substrate-binding protein
MNLEGGVASLDPAFARDQAATWMTAQLYNGLVELDSGLEVRPAIAKSWEISADGKVYTFHLRQDVRFHSDPAFGSDSSRLVIASDFVYSFTRICDPATASTGKWIFSGKIEGLESFQAGEKNEISGFTALDDSTLRIALLRPFPPFPGLLAMPYAFVVPKEAVARYGTDFRAHPVGTGPFHFFRWEEGNFLTLHRNQVYFERENGAQLPYLKAVHVKFIPSKLSAFIEFVQGRLDFINGIDDSYKDEILGTDGKVKEAYARKYKVALSPQLNTEYLGFLMEPPVEGNTENPLSDIRVRKALNYAIDRESLVRYLLNGMGTAGHSGFVPMGMPGFDPQAVPGYTYQPAKARALLEEAGYPGGRGFPPITLNSTSAYGNISEFIQKSFENIGVELKIQNLQGGALRKEVYSQRVQLWRASWIADYPDPENYLGLFYSPNHAPDGPNTTHFSEPEFDRLYEKSQTQTADSQRFPVYHQMENIMLEKSPVIILYYDRIIRLSAPEISGLSTNPMNHLSLKRVKKERN